MIESRIEHKVCEYAKSKGFLVYKFTSPNRSAVPDRMLIYPSGFVFFIEFKAGGKVATPQQEREHIRLRGHKIDVYVIDDVAEGEKVIDSVVWECKCAEDLLT